jgi:hypothetical protein
MISKPGATKPKPGATKSKPDATKTKLDFLPQFELFQWVPPLFGVVRHSSLLPPGRSSGSGTASDEIARLLFFVNRLMTIDFQNAGASASAILFPWPSRIKGPGRAFFRTRKFPANQNGRCGV